MGLGQWLQAQLEASGHICNTEPVERGSGTVERVVRRKRCRPSWSPWSRSIWGLCFCRLSDWFVWFWGWFFN